MKNTFFSDMYYPSDRQELEKLCSVTPLEGHTPALVLLPHAGLDFVGGLYREAFARIHSPRRIVLLSAIHGEKMEDDASSSLFTLTSDDMETPLGPVKIQAVEGLKVNDSYAEEEYALEILAPYVALNCPESVLMPIFASLSTKEDIQALTRVMVRLKKEDNDTLFIISGNFTAMADGRQVNQMAKTLNELLENNAPLLDAGGKGRISGCAWRMLEAARTAFPGHFRVIKARCGAYYGDTISQDADGRIWQVFAIKD